MKKILFLILFFCFNNLLAKEYFVEDNGEIEVVISRDNINRIKIFNDRIKDIRANSDEIIVDADKKLGEIYIRPAFGKDNIDVYLNTENSFNYKLILKVEDIKSQQIFLNREDFTLKKYADSDILRRQKLKLIDENLYFNFEENFKLSAINLIRAMSLGIKLQDFNIVNRNYENIINYKDLKANWIVSYVQNKNLNISGEIIKITNISNKDIVLDEKMFFKKGIRAIRLESLVLKPNNSTFLYLIGGE